MRPGFAPFVAVCSLNASIAGLAIPMLPIIIEALASSNHMNSKILGLLAFLELGGAAVTSIAVSWQIRKFNAATLCACGSLLLAAADLGSAFAVASPEILLPFRLVAGIGTGLMSAGMLALVARVPNPEQMYGILGFAPCISASLGFTVAPNLIHITGNAAGVFAFWGFFAVLNAICMVAYRRQLIDFVETAVRDRAQKRKERDSLPVAAGLNVVRTSDQIGPGVLFLSLGSISLLAFCDAAIWAFVGPIGEQTGLSIEGLSRVLIITAIVACLGPLLAARLGTRFGVLPPLVIGQVTMIVLSLLMVLTRQYLLYGAALALRVVAVLFLVPRYSGLFARIDPVGRVVAAAAGCQGIAYGVGPLIGGQVIALSEGSFLILGLTAAAASGISLLMTLVLVTHRNRTADIQAVQN